jgi:DNA-binding transcriptional regulator YiaG
MNAFTDRLVPIEVEEPVDIPPTTPGGQVRTILVKVPAMKDPKDGEIYLGADATAILDKAKARHLGVLAPQELAELRKRLDLTQKEIAEVLQIGEKTWSCWENGREIVSRSLNLLLLSLYEGKINLPWLRAKLGENKQLVSAMWMVLRIRMIPTVASVTAHSIVAESASGNFSRMAGFTVAPTRGCVTPAPPRFPMRPNANYEEMLRCA